MADSPLINKDRVLAYSIYADGSKLNDHYTLVSAEIHLELNRIGKATLKFDADDKHPFDESDDDRLKPGNALRLDAGTAGREETLFDGFIIGIRISAGKNARSFMIVECRDYTYQATQSRRNCIFEEKKDSEMIKETLGSYGTVQMDETPYRHPTLVQYYCTDWDFALSRADANGLFIYTKGRRIQVCKPGVGSSPVLTVTYGTDLIEFDLELSGSDQFSQYEAISWNPADQKAVKAAASAPSLNKQGDLQPKSIATNESLLLQTDAPTEENALRQWVNAMALKAGLARYQGTFSFYGTGKVEPGCLIELKGAGKRFDGNVFVGSVRHTIANNEWVTEAGAGISPVNNTDKPDVIAPAASGILPGSEGLHAAVVKRLDGDPKKEHRILVELPWLDGRKRELWARLSTLYATNGSGSLFAPEPGDEVLVGFMNQDPSHPIILGALYGTRHKPPYEYEGKNNTKAIVTREKMKIEFDEEKKIITISTPGNNRVEMSDDGKFIRLTDFHKNEIMMSNSGISLVSGKDIVLKAKGNITMDATMKATMTAKSDVSIDGLNVKVNAKVGVTVKGNATAELSASGQTTVKGAMVMIN